MRLIDADKLMQFLYDKKDEEEQHLGIENDVSVMIGSIGFEVMNMPTAFDIDKVVQELEENTYKMEICEEIPSKRKDIRAYADVQYEMLKLDDVISILKRGGLNKHE